MRHQNYKILAERMKEDAFHKNCSLSVLVEDIYDERFWEYFLENAHPELRDKVDFPNPVPNGTRGKDILKKFRGFVDERLIICCDSDSEYLYDEKVWYLADYVYHTIFYSKESFQCHHLVLHEIAKDLTGKSYDFKKLFETISYKISPLFYFWIYLKEQNFYAQFKTHINNRTFEEILDFKGISLEVIGDETLLYRKIEERVTEKLKNLSSKMGTNWYKAALTYDIPQLQERLKEEHGIRETDVLLFCNGHKVFNFMRPLMQKMVSFLKVQKIEETTQTLHNRTAQKNAIHRIENRAKQDLKTKLNDGFKHLIFGTNDHPTIQKIKNKLKKDL